MARTLYYKSLDKHMEVYLEQVRLQEKIDAKQLRLAQLSRSAIDLGMKPADVVEKLSQLQASDNTKIFEGRNPNQQLLSVMIPESPLNRPDSTKSIQFPTQEKVSRPGQFGLSQDVLTSKLGQLRKTQPNTPSSGIPAKKELTTFQKELNEKIKGMNKGRRTEIADLINNESETDKIKRKGRIDDSALVSKKKIDAIDVANMIDDIVNTIPNKSYEKNEAIAFENLDRITNFQQFDSAVKKVIKANPDKQFIEDPNGISSIPDIKAFIKTNKIAIPVYNSIVKTKAKNQKAKTRKSIRR